MADETEWRPICEAPPHMWIRTRREGEDGENECFASCYLNDDAVTADVEWCDRSGLTTMTHSTFLPPTHWAPLVPKSPIPQGERDA